MDTPITELVSRLLFTLPYVAVWFAAIALCMQFRKSSRRETTFLIIGFAIQIVHILVFNILQTLLLSNYDGMVLPLSTMLTILHGIGIVINLIAWTLILTGIYQLLQKVDLTK